MSGVGTTTAAEVFSERVELQPRTSDPTNTEEGEAWIRSDIAPESNQIATLRVDTGGSTIDVPILQTGTAVDDVVEALRLSVGGTLGYVPAIAESKAAFPALRLQHNGQVYGWHDVRGETAFFDVAIAATNSPVDDGETLTVDYSVENTGGSLNDTQDIRLEVGSTERDRDSAVTVASGGSTTGQLSWGSASQGSYTASVVSDDDVASTSVSVESAIPDSVVSRPQDGNNTQFTAKAGIAFESDDDWESIGGEISNNTLGHTTAYIHRVSDDFLIDSIDISALSAGDSFVFDGVNLDANTEYVMLFDAGGSSWDAGRPEDIPTYPISSNDGNLRIIGRHSGDNSDYVVDTDGHPYSIVTIGNVGFD